MPIRLRFAETVPGTVANSLPPTSLVRQAGCSAPPRRKGFLAALGSVCDDSAVVEWFGRWFDRWFGDDELPDYDLPDPDLAAYDHSLGQLRFGGELKGYLASVRLEMSFPARQRWPWFVIVWADGRKDRAFED